MRRVDPIGLRDIIVAIWTSRIAEKSVGHVFTGELSSITLTSQFPSPYGRLGRNTTLSWQDTIRVEGRDPDYVYQVKISDDINFDKEILRLRNVELWYFLPDGRNATHCANAAVLAMRAGGITNPPLSNPLLPNHLNASLLMKSLFDPNVVRLPRAPW